jgi:hypothetical protein
MDQVSFSLLDRVKTGDKKQVKICKNREIKMSKTVDEYKRAW